MGVRVVSMPSREWSADQDAAYREGVLPGSVTAARDRRGRRILRVHDIAGRDGIIVGIDGFGVSATADQALVARGMTPARVLAAIDESVQLADR